MEEPKKKGGDLEDLPTEALEDDNLADAYTVGHDTEPTGPADDLRPRFGRYEVRGVRGRGGFATVYAGYDAQLDRQVAIKVPSAKSLKPGMLDAFRREARNLARLRHPGIVTVYDVGVEGDRCYIVSDLLVGQSLHDWLKENTPSWREAAEVVAAVAEALAHAHERSIVHRDVKPGNVIMTPDRGPVVVDFGIAATDSVRESDIGNFTGTPAFMSPEQISGRGHRIDGRTDIYSLGVMLYTMLCGRVPFRARSTPELARQIREDEPQPPRQLVPNLPAELERICLTAMAKNVAERYTTAMDMAHSLRALIDGNGDGEARDRAGAAAAAPERAAVERPEMERRHLTLLAATWEVLDPEAELDLDERAERESAARAQIEEIVGRYEGTVMQASSTGVDVCFGYPVAQEDAARRAVYAALDIRDGLGGPDGSCPVDLWLAVHTGTVVAQLGEDKNVAITGDAATIVKRIDAVTEPGDVVVTRETHRMIPGFFETDELGEFKVRGAADGLQLHVVRQAISGAHSLVVDDVELSPLVGRDLEMGLLFDRWAKTTDGMAQAILLIGDAGLGKSRLVHVLKEHVAVTDAEVPIIEWRCSPYHANSALYPAIEYFQRTLGFRHDDRPEERRERLKEYLRGTDLDLGEAVPLMCDLLDLPADDEYPPLDVGSQRQKELTIDLLASWLSLRAAREPQLFIVEDLHWIDPSSLELLGGLVDTPPADPVMCVFTFRPEFTTPWTSRAHQTQIALNRLSRAQIEEMIRTNAEVEEVTDALVQHVMDRTDGVPLFVEEFTKALVESGALANLGDPTEMSISTRDSMDTVTRLSIPDSLQDLLMARLERLGGNNAIIQTAAAVGREFGLEVLAAAAELLPDEVAAELDDLVDAEILYRRGRGATATYVFKHALIQDAAYESMVTRERRRVHERIARTLAEYFPETVAREPEVQAHHLAEAGLYDESLQYWSAAAGRAVEGSNYPEALSHLGRAMGLIGELPESPERDQRELGLNVLLGIATLSVKGYASPELGEIYARRYAICDQMGDEMGRLHAMWAEASWRIVRDEMDRSKELGELMTELAEAMDDDGARMEAHFIVSIAAFYRGELQLALDASEAAMALYDADRCLWHMARLGQHAGVASLCYGSLARWLLGDPAGATEQMERAWQMAQDIEHPFTMAFALHHYGWLMKLARLGNEGQRRGEEQMSVSQDQGFFFWETTGMMYRAAGLVEQARFDEALEQLDLGLQRYAMTGAALGLPYYSGWLAESHLGRGDLDAAGQALDAAEAAMDTSGERFNAPEVRRLRGVAATAAGRSDEAEAHYLDARKLAESAGARSFALRAAVSLTEELAETDRAAEALEVLAAEVAHFDESVESVDLTEARALMERLS